MTNCPDDTPLADDIPAADAAEQHQPAADSAEDAGLDPRCVADLLQRDANPSDVIDQAIIVPLPDDDPDTRRHRVLSTGNVVVAAKQHAAAWPGPVQQVRPRGAGGADRGVLTVRGRLALGQRHQCISQTHSAHVVRLGGLHDLDERVVERAAPQRNEHAFGGVEDPCARPTRILRSARRVQLTLPPAVYSYPITYHITCGINHIFYHPILDVVDWLAAAR